MLKQKEIKQMQMDALEDTFRDVNDFVILSPTGLDVITENRIRLDLRKKNIQLMLVKNNYMRRVLEKVNLEINDCWTGPTMLAWGGDSVAQLSKELDKVFKKNEKVEFKGAVAEGQHITFEHALKMPTKAEAIGRVIQLFLSPATNLVSQIRGPGGQVASQIKSISEESSAEKPDA